MIESDGRELTLGLYSPVSFPLRPDTTEGAGSLGMGEGEVIDVFDAEELGGMELISVIC